MLPEELLLLNQVWNLVNLPQTPMMYQPPQAICKVCGTERSSYMLVFVDIAYYYSCGLRIRKSESLYRWLHYSMGYFYKSLFIDDVLWVLCLGWSCNHPSQRHIYITNWDMSCAYKKIWGCFFSFYSFCFRWIKFLWWFMVANSKSFRG